MNSIRTGRPTRILAIVGLSISAWLSPAAIVTQQSARAQTVPAPLKSDAIPDTLAKGLDFERNRRWGEAVQLYEKASKKHPEDQEVKRRLLISRVHFDVHRRYSSQNFPKSVASLNAEKSLELYGEILAKLEANYVDPLNLPEIMRNGTAFLEVALTEPDFVKTHLAGTSADAIENFRANIHRVVIGRPIRSRFEARQLVEHVANLAAQDLRLSQSATIHEYICGAVGLLDPYSGFLTADDLREVMSQIEGNFVGLGVGLRTRPDRLEIENVIQGSPAAEAGIVAGDIIIAVDNATTAEVGSERAADMLRGPENTRVRLVVKNVLGTQRELFVSRRRVEVPSIETAELIDAVQGIAYIRISSFQKTTERELDKALWMLHGKSMKSLIIDLRGNPGGLLDGAVKVADRFISSGPIVSTRGRNGLENQSFLAQANGTWSIPLVVLIDGDSASASEIFAGAIYDHNRGTVVGQTSYGKGSVQGLFHTDAAEAGLRLTVSKFFSPSGAAISSKGVTPHIPVDSSSADGTTVVVAKPILNSSGEYVLDPVTSIEDKALQVSLDYARNAIRTAARK